MATSSTEVRPPPGEVRPKNKLLAALPREEFHRLQPHLRLLPVRLRQVFHHQNEPIQDIVFLNGGVASVTALMQDGTMIETATIGYEGVVADAALFGGDRAAAENMLQVPNGEAYFMALDAFRTELDGRNALFGIVQRYTQALVKLMMQSTACMATHGVQERCCRWLLTTHDRVQDDSFQLSQEFLAMMLGATRPTVSVVASTLQKAGLISYRYGRITVLDRAGLEAASCECYSTVKAHFDRLGL